jgi:hypothetical protein
MSAAGTAAAVLSAAEASRIVRAASTVAALPTVVAGTAAGIAKSIASYNRIRNGWRRNSPPAVFLGAGYAVIFSSLCGISA